MLVGDRLEELADPDADGEARTMKPNPRMLYWLLAAMVGLLYYSAHDNCNLNRWLGATPEERVRLASCISAHKMLEGMSFQQVTSALGSPDRHYMGLLLNGVQQVDLEFKERRGSV